MSKADEASPVQGDVRLHPCRCTAYNGGQCYNCLNGAHDICSATKKCRQRRDKVLGLPIVVQSNGKLT